jgi:hypothetical protein
MTRIALAALLVGVMSGTSGTSGTIAAQAPAGGGVGSWYTATTTIVKPGMMNEYRQLVIKEANPAAKKGGATQIQTWRFATGNTDRVLRIVLHNSLADRDAGPAARRGMGEAGWTAYQKKVAALIESTSGYIGQQRLDMGWNPPGSPAPKLAERYTVRIAPGRNAEYLKYVQAFLEASKKSGHRRTAGQVVFGPNTGTFISNTFYENYADLEKGRPPNRTMSPSELAAFNALNPPGLITVVSRDITMFDAEMSITPPASSSR